MLRISNRLHIFQLLLQCFNRALLRINNLLQIQPLFFQLPPRFLLLVPLTRLHLLLRLIHPFLKGTLLRTQPLLRIENVRVFVLILLVPKSEQVSFLLDFIQLLQQRLVFCCLRIQLALKEFTVVFESCERN
jgi:hypothetical protein